MTFAMDAASLALDRLRSTNSLPKYLAIQGRFDRTDVSVDRAFQKAFKGFYRIRRDQRWCDLYFSYLERSKENRRAVSFGGTLSHLHQTTGRVEASFAAKGVATLDPSAPVWDSMLLSYWKLRAPPATHKDRLDAVNATYSALSERMHDLLASASGQSVVGMFDRAFPSEAPLVTPMKKLDLTLWQLRQ